MTNDSNSCGGSCLLIFAGMVLIAEDHPILGFLVILAGLD